MMGPSKIFKINLMRIRCLTIEYKLNKGLNNSKLKISICHNNYFINLYPKSKC